MRCFELIRQPSLSPPKKIGELLSHTYPTHTPPPTPTHSHSHPHAHAHTGREGKAERTNVEYGRTHTHFKNYINYAALSCSAPNPIEL